MDAYPIYSTYTDRLGWGLQTDFGYQRVVNQQKLNTAYRICLQGFKMLRQPMFFFKLAKELFSLRIKI